MVWLLLRPVYNHIEMLNNFIKDSTHDINAPLSVISMSIETLKSENLNEYNKQRFENIKNAAKTLSLLYDDLIFLNFQPKARNLMFIDMAELCKSRCGYFGDIISKNALNLKLSLKPSFLNADYNDITKMFDNLLSNAIKYSNHGGFIEVKTDSGFMEISNSGDGISKENLQKIYDRFTRFNSEQGGFGIGLNIVKTICQIYKIEISCQSLQNEITKFTLKWHTDKI